MKTKVSIVLIFILFFLKMIAQVENSYYLPNIEYKENIPDPASILGFQIGEWHITHGQLLQYMTAVCESSPNCQLVEYARSHENKPLIQLVISSTDNLKDLDKIKKARRKAIDKGQKEDLQNLPMVIYQGYSIHGNESSGANASTLIAYYLLAGQSDHLTQLLDEAIIIIDPCFNPDGFQRFSTWANMHKHHTLTTDPTSREFNEVWPQGRTNHYWFDLNRDWLFTIHPSSKGRIEQFQQWQPDILTDHHEMGSNSTFFFQPGVPSRTNPNTPQVNQDLTTDMAAYHRNNLDSIGSKYFSGKRFDDYYYGKGSTYPDINGCVGILFEQASCRGHLRETDNGLLSFPFTIRNQVVTSLSTQKGALDLKEKIITYKTDFFTSKENKKGAYLFKKDSKAYEAAFFVDILNRHDIKVYQVDSKTTSVEKQNINPSEWLVVPKNQRHSGLIKTIFEPVSEFRDSLFYDVSAWTMPMAFNMESIESNKDIKLGQLISADDLQTIPAATLNTKDASQKVMTMDWSQYNAPTAVHQLLLKGLKVRAISDNYEKGNPSKGYPTGTIIISLKGDTLENNYLSALDKMTVVQNICTELKVKTKILSINDIVKYKTKEIKKPQVAMLVGEGMNPYECGSTWYQMDHRLNMQVTQIDIRQFKNVKLERYTHLILPDGRYREGMLNDDKIDKWISNGGTLIALRGALKYTNKKNWTTLETVPEPAIKVADDSNSQGAQRIGGAIFNTRIDLTHPLFYGYTQSALPIFKRGTQFYVKSPNPKACPMSYTQSPLLSGYTSLRNQQMARNAAGINCFSHKKGKIIALVDNPNFRGYWLGGSKLFANCLYFSDFIASDQLQN